MPPAVPSRSSRPATRPIARFDDLRSGTTLQFSNLTDEVVAYHPDQVLDALRRVDEASRQGSWCFGFLAYEAASGLDPDLRTREPIDGFPLVWFGLADGPDIPVSPAGIGGAHQVGQWSLDWDEPDHARHVAAVREAIARGETYQCNLTTTLRGELTGDLLGYYLDLAANQRGSYNAFLDLDRWAILSASPERFFGLRDDILTVTPMKGTARRAPLPAVDDRVRHELRTNPKDRAENVMIVDLIRNDLNHICRAGTVAVTELLAAEKYPTVWQLTSTVTGQLRERLGLAEIFTSLFPCGSVTGAPKISTMDLIRQLETSPRGVYCGAIGYLAPGRHAEFSVAIRTLLVDRNDDSASYGVGGGVTWSSTAEGEYQELLAKARILTAAAPAAVELIETLAVVDSQPRNLTEHLERMASSAGWFDFAFDQPAIEEAVRQVRGTWIIRIRLARDGSFTLEPRTLAVSPPDPVRLALDDRPIDQASPFIYHKTTHREFYAAALARHPGADDVVLVNPLGHVTETTTANLAARLDGTWFTPPPSDGLLPGIGRRLAIEQGRLTERSLSIADLRRADSLAVISSVRGWRAARLI